MGVMSDDPSDLEPQDLEGPDLEPIDLTAGDGSGQSATSWAPGWYADPWTAGQYRMWNGSAWTGETRISGPADTTAVGATSLGYRPPVAPLSMPVYRPAYAPVRSQPRRQAGGRTAAIVAGLVALVLVAGAGGYAIETSAESDNSATASRQPTPSTTPGTLTPAPAAADRSALSSLVVRQSDIGSSRVVVLIPDGNRTTEATLDLCNGTFPSEKQRVARLQVAELTPSGGAVLSTEAVTYKRAAGGAQAFAELRKVRAACPHQPVTSPVGGDTLETAFRAAPDGAWPHTKSVERLAYSFTTTLAGKTRPSVAVYLRRGRVLMGVYFSRPSGAQPAVGGKTSLEGMVGLFEARMARLPATVVNG